MKYYHYQRGFTLIESLVAVTLFMVAITAAVSLFLIYSKSQKETGLRQKTLSQMSFDIEKLSQDIRLKRINFQDTAGFRTGSLYALDGDAGIVGKEWELGLIGNNNIKETYFFVSLTEPPPTPSINCAGSIGNNGRGVLYRFSSARCEPVFNVSQVRVVDVGFYISPNYSPYPQKDADCKITAPGTFNGYYCQCSQIGGVWQNNECHSNLCNEGFCSVSQPVITLTFTLEIMNNPNDRIHLQTSVSSRKYTSP